MSIPSPAPHDLSGARYTFGTRVAVGAMTVVLVTLPFAHSVAVRTIALGVALCAALVAWRALRVPRMPMLWYFVLLAAIGGLSLVWSVDPEYSRGELKTELLYPFLVFVFMFAITRDRRTLVWWGAAIALAIVLSVTGPFGAWLDPSTGRPARGVLYNGAGFYSTWIVIVYPFVLAAALSTTLTARSRQIAFALAIAAVVAGYVTFNRTFPFVIVLETIVLVSWSTFARTETRRYLPLALAAIATVMLLAGLIAVQKERLVVSPTHDADVVVSMQRDVRWALWGEALERIAVKPLQGAGFGRGILRHELPKRYDNTYLWHAHNFVLNSGLQMGVPGMALILALFGAALWHLGRAYRVSDESLRPYVVAAMVMVAGVFLKNQTDDFFVRQTALAFWAALGALLGVTARMKRDRERVPAPA